MLLLDTRLLPAEDREEAVVTAMGRASVPTDVRSEVSGEALVARMGLAQLGTGVDVFSHGGTGIRLTRRDRHLRQASPERVALAVQVRGTGRYEQGGRQLVVPTGQLMLVDLTSTYDFRWTGRGSSVAFQVDLVRLGLPVEVVRRAVGQLGGSALSSLVRGHLVRLARDVDAVSASAAGPLVGAATVDLVRALVVDAAGHPAREAHADALPTRVVAWVRQHLSEPDLTPTRIAQEHAISVRQLYRIWPEPGGGVADWVLRERLEGARQALVSDSRGIAVVARAWGFADATHFGRRFRDAYGLSPTQWRAAAQAPVPEQRAGGAGRDVQSPDRQVNWSRGRR